MTKLHVLTLSLLLASPAAALAASGSLNQFTPRVMPVLVQVNAQGKVTDMSPALDLTPQMTRLLRSNIDELIAGPAVLRGKPVASQLVLNLVLQATPQPQGDYLAQFSYVSSSPVPSGSWYWVHIDGHRLALAERGSQRNFERMPAHGMQRAWPTHNTAPVLPAQSAIQAAPAPMPTAMPAQRSR